MKEPNNFQRYFLLIIIVLFVYLFISGKAVETPEPDPPVIIP